MSHQYKAVAAMIKNSIESINAILTSPEDEMHRIRIVNDLQRSHDQLLLLTGAGDLATEQLPVLGPAKTIGGKPISKQRQFTEADLVPSDDKVFKLKQDIEDAMVYFGREASSEGILANIPELIIRGVAKKAGLKVTKDEPKELTVEFIEQVKLALAAKNEPLAGVGGVSESHILNPEDIGAPMGEGIVTIPDPLTTEANQQPVETEGIKTEELKQEVKPKPETDTKKKAGK